MTPARGGSQDKLGHHLCPEAPLSPEDTGVTGRQLQRGLNGVQWRGVLRAAGRELRGGGGGGRQEPPLLYSGALQQKGARTGPRTAAAARSSPHLRPEPQARCGPVSQPTRKPECVITKPRVSANGAGARRPSEPLGRANVPSQSAFDSSQVRAGATLRKHICSEQLAPCHRAKDEAHLTTSCREVTVRWTPSREI